MGEMADLLNEEMEKGQSRVLNQETGEVEIVDNTELMYGSPKWRKYPYKVLGDYIEE